MGKNGHVTRARYTHRMMMVLRALEGALMQCGRLSAFPRENVRWSRPVLLVLTVGIFPTGGSSPYNGL